MPSVSPSIEIGTFTLVRKSSGSAVTLHPAGGDRTGDQFQYPDERSSQADERAHLMQVMLDRGEVKNRSELAAFFGISRARVSQILGRLNPTSSKEVGR